MFYFLWIFPRERLRFLQKKSKPFLRFVQRWRFPMRMLYYRPDQAVFTVRKMPNYLKDILWANLFSGFLQLQSSALSCMWLSGRPYETAFWQRSKAGIQSPSRIRLRRLPARTAEKSMIWMTRIARAAVIQNRKQRQKAAMRSQYGASSGFVFIPPGKPHRRPCQWQAAHRRFHPAG